MHCQIGAGSQQFVEAPHVGGLNIPVYAGTRIYIYIYTHVYLQEHKTSERQILICLAPNGKFVYMAQPS